MTQSNIGIYASQISGHLWAPNGAYDALATVTVPSGGVYSLTFAGIPQGYKHLQIRATCKSNVSGNGDSFHQVQFNGDTAANYSNHFLYGTGGGSYSTGATSASYMQIYNLVFSGSNGAWASTIIDIPDYTSTTKAKTLKYFSGWDGNGSGDIQVGSGLWFKTPEAINSITFNAISPGNLYAQNTQFSLYGVK